MHRSRVAAKLLALAWAVLMIFPPDVAADSRTSWQARVVSPQAVEIQVTLGDTTASGLLAIPWWGDAVLEVTNEEADVLPHPALSLPDDLPSGPADVQTVGFLRGVRLARVVVHPRYLDQEGRMHTVRRLTVRLRFPPPPEGVPPGDVEPPAVERVLRNVLLNATFPRSWRRPRSWALDEIAVDNPPAHDPHALKVYTTDDGIYVITRQDVTQAGWDAASLDPRHVHLWLNGTEVPIWFPGQEDGHWDAEDEIRFYSPPFRSMYTRERVWWLTVDDRPGRRWRAVPTGTPEDSPITTVWAVVETEHDRVYDSSALDGHGEHWFWYDLKFLDFAPYPALDFPFSIPDPADSPQALVTLSLYAYAGDVHDMAFSLNGVSFGELHGTWSGRRDLTFSLPDVHVRNGENMLTIQGTDRGAHPDGVYVDRITVRYRRRLDASSGKLAFVGEAGDHTYEIAHLPPGIPMVVDVSNPLDPVLIYGIWAYERWEGTNHLVRFRAQGNVSPTYLIQLRETWQRAWVEANIASDLHDPDEGADVVVIAPRVWHSFLNPWVQWREQQGHQVRVVALQDVYDEFSYGQEDPTAIRRFLWHAYANWPAPAPLYVLLVGDGSYDFKDNLGFHPDNILPPYLDTVDPWLGETASDLRYVEVSGGDDIPDMFIGRWPVGNPEELQVVLRKTLYYGQEMPVAEWQRHIAFVADNYRSATGQPDPAGDFATLADETAVGQLHVPFRVHRIYYAPWPEHPPGPQYYENADDVRHNIRLLWNQGVGIMNWVGHASYEQWGEENFLHARELDDLHNADRLPFLFSITCFTGYFHHPEYASLDEALLVKPDGGTVASWSPTGLAVAYGHRYLQYGFYRALLNGERSIGPLTLAGHLYLHSQAETYTFLSQTYVTLGDPLLRLKLGPVNWTWRLPIMP